MKRRRPLQERSPAAATELLRLRLSAGMDPVDRSDLPPRTRRIVHVARSVGAPLSDALDAGLTAEQDARQAARAVAVASAQTRVVAGGLLLAPIVLVPVLGRLVGADLVSFYSSTTGGMVLGVGTVLLVAGGLLVIALVRRVARPVRAETPAWASRSLVAGPLVAWWAVGPLPAVAVAVGFMVVARRFRGPAPLPGLDEAADLVATARSGGTTTAEALRLTADCLPHLAQPLRRLAFDLDAGRATDPHAASPTRDLGRLTEVLLAAHEFGAPVAPALRRFAADLRADELARVLAAAERLPAQLTFPTALCLLPATVLLVGAPIVHAGLAAAGA